MGERVRIEPGSCRFRGHDMDKVEAVLYPDVFGTCEACGQPFKLGSYRKRFCSERCANNFHQWAFKERQRFGETHKCPMCGRTFKGRRDQVCCSQTCARALDHRRRRNV